MNEIHFTGLDAEEIIELTVDGRIIYLKNLDDRTGEFEVSLDSLKFELINI